MKLVYQDNQCVKLLICLIFTGNVRFTMDMTDGQLYLFYLFVNVTHYYIVINCYYTNSVQII